MKPSCHSFTSSVFHYDIENGPSILPAWLTVNIIQCRQKVGKRCFVSLGFCVKTRILREEKNKLISSLVAFLILIKPLRDEGHHMPNHPSITGSHHILKH